MRDDELRVLERDARASKNPEALVRYADALERIGRAADAIEALWTGIESPVVRERLTGLGGPRTALSGSEPKLLWKIALGGATRTSTRFHAVLPCAIICSAEDALRTVEDEYGDSSVECEPSGIILDPLSGTQRAILDQSLPVGAWRDVVVCSHEPRPATESVTIGCDLWTGSRLWRASLAQEVARDRARFELAPDGVAAYEYVPGSDAPINAFFAEVLDPRTGPREFSRIKGLPTRGWLRRVQATTRFLAATLHVRSGTFSVVARRRSNELVFQGSGAVILHESGWLTLDDEALRAYDESGKIAWETMPARAPLVGSGFVLCYRSNDVGVLIRLEDGVERRIPTGLATLLSLASDGIVAAAGHEIQALTLDGEVVWRTSLEGVLDESERLTDLMPLGRSLFGFTNRGTLFRLAP